MTLPTSSSQQHSCPCCLLLPFTHLIATHHSNLSDHTVRDLHCPSHLTVSSDLSHSNMLQLQCNWNG